MKIQREAEVIERAAVKMGYAVTRSSCAGTGTYYYTFAYYCDAYEEGECTRACNCNEVSVRVSDHDAHDCAGHTIADIEVGGECNGVTKERCIRVMAESIGANVPAWVVRNERAKDSKMPKTANPKHSQKHEDALNAVARASCCGNLKKYTAALRRLEDVKRVEAN